MSWKTFFITLLFVGYCAGGWITFSPALQAGAQCIVEVKTLHPTQFAVGYWEIDRRAEKVIDKSGKKLERYLEEHVGKIVIGPGGEPYIIDRHHLACIMDRIGKNPMIFAVVEANFKALTVDSFWIEMTKRKWVYLYDENGNGPLDPRLLPKYIKEMKDDPFRSIAWEVRERGGFRKTDDPFAEFQWANFFRSKLATTNADLNMERLIEDALQMCRSSSASKLPGYLKEN